MADVQSTANSTSKGMGLLGWLTFAFVILKLDPGSHLTSDVVNWSWWLVFSPILVGIALLVLALAIFLLIFGGAALIDRIQRAKRRKVLKQRAAAKKKIDEERVASRKALALKRNTL